MANCREYAVLQSKTRGGSEIWAGGLGVVGVLWAGARLGGKLMTLTEVKAALAEAEVVPSKKLGQNFLCDQNSAAWIVKQLQLEEGDCVVEVGPGTGALTEQVRGKVRKVILVEFDRRLAAWLTKRFEDDDSVEVIHEDGAQFDIRRLFKEGPVKLLGNLPYSAGGAILRNFLNAPSPVSRAVIMLQREVIDRIVAEPRTKAYGVLGLRMQSEWKSKPLKTIAPELFHPRPTIDSTVMLVEPRRDDLPVYDMKLFDELMRRGFAQRRKQLRKAMPDRRVWAEVAAEIGCSETARPEELSILQWVNLTRAYDDHPLKDNPQRGDEMFDVVNENDEVVGQEQRAVVHETGLMHRAVHVFLLNKVGEVFLQKRSRLKDVHPGRWDSSAAGHLEVGEAYEDSARRELGEELGQDGEELALVGKLPASEKTGMEFVELFTARTKGGLRYPCSEVETGMWLDPEEIDGWVARRPEEFADGFMECWRLWRHVP
jgi:16S rRNA (adenine1518-N6/adenine1519-N6)-dimethyltransferase